MKPAAWCASAALLAATACGDNQHEAVVASSLWPHLGFIPGLCMRMEVVGDPRPHCTWLRNFTFEWGVEATVRYHIEDVDDGLVDGPSYHNVVDRVLERRPDPVGTLYTLWFAWEDDGYAPTFRPLAADAVNMIWEHPVACDAALCEQLLALKPPFDLDVVLTGETIPIRAVAVRPRP